jgi:hypothetical protein
MSADIATFLRFPQELRWRIYHQRAENDILDLARIDQDRESRRGLKHLIALGYRDGIIFAYARNSGVASFAYTLDLLKMYNELRLISRVVNAEILPCICSRYLILVHGSALLEVPHLWSAYLSKYCRNIAIDLTHSMCWQVGCRTWGRRCPLLGRKCKVRKCAYFNHVLKYDEDIVFQQSLTGWEELASCLLRSPSVQDTQLWLWCSTTDPVEAERIMAPLTSLRLRKCHVRLNLKYNQQLADIARRAVLLSTSHHLRNNAPFSFLDLPPELRQHVLSYTDLVTPLHEVQWFPSQHFQLARGKLDFEPTGTCRWKLFCSHL